MKLYLINNICVSTTPINGVVEVEIPTVGNDNPSNYLNMRITIFEGGYKVEIPSQKELSDAEFIFNLISKNQTLEQAIVELTLMVGGATNVK